MDKVHKPITTQYYTALSKPFRIYLTKENSRESIRAKRYRKGKNKLFM
jgi:hypothetical protein